MITILLMSDFHIILSICLYDFSISFSIAILENDLVKEQQQNDRCSH